MLDEEQGRLVAREAVAVSLATFGYRLELAHLIGSLAHGGFVAAVSDVDIALVLGDRDPGDPSRVQQVAQSVVERDRSALARRLSIFWSTAGALREGRPDGRLPAIDWLDLVQSGELTHGTSLPANTPRPTAEQLVQESAAFAVTKWRHDPDWDRHLLDAPGLVTDGRRAASKAALFPVRFLYTLATGRAGSTSDAVTWYSSQPHGTSRDLVRAAYSWRTEGFGDAAAAIQILQRQLVPLYLEFGRAYRERLLRQGLDQLAHELNATIARLG